MSIRSGLLFATVVALAGLATGCGASRISGRVFDKEDRPIEGVWLYNIDATPKPASGQGGFGLTDSNGWFDFEPPGAVLEGNQRLAFEKKGYTTSNFVFTRVPERVLLQREESGSK